jgi:GAF domain-containing protein
MASLNDPQRSSDGSAERQREQEDLYISFDRAASHLAFLAEASRILSSSLDLHTVFNHLVELIVPHLCDWCTVSLVKDDGSIERVASAHFNPTKAELARKLEKDYPVSPNTSMGMAGVVRTGKSEFHPEVDADAFADKYEDYSSKPGFGDFIQQLGVESSMGVAMKADGKVIGGIWFMSAGSGRHFTKDDLRIAEELSNRAALAVQNAAAYSRATNEMSRLAVEQSVRENYISRQVHDIQTPLTAAKLMLDLIRRKMVGNPAEAMELIEKSIQNVDRAAKMTYALRNDEFDELSKL